MLMHIYKYVCSSSRWVPGLSQQRKMVNMHFIDRVSLQRMIFYTLHKNKQVATSEIQLKNSKDHSLKTNCKDRYSEYP